MNWNEHQQERMKPGYYCDERSMNQLVDESEVNFFVNDPNVHINFLDDARQVYITLILEEAGEEGLTEAAMCGRLQEWDRAYKAHHNRVLSDARFYKEHVITHDYT